jgi:hypothetical protein
MCESTYVSIRKTSKEKYSVSVFHKIRDPFLSIALGRDYDLWDFKVFDTKKEAEDYASSYKRRE